MNAPDLSTTWLLHLWLPIFLKYAETQIGKQECSAEYRKKNQEKIYIQPCIYKTIYIVNFVLKYRNEYRIPPTHAKKTAAFVYFLCNKWWYFKQQKTRSENNNNHLNEQTAKKRRKNSAKPSTQSKTKRNETALPLRSINL